LKLAWDTLRAPAGSTAILNAANEEAVAAFLEGRVRFDQIHAVNEQTLQRIDAGTQRSASIEALLELDAEARRHAAHIIKGLPC
jgi:1-deoxy-D-xylulose-5-phosphate reductoisomerase